MQILQFVSHPFGEIIVNRRRITGIINNLTKLIPENKLRVVWLLTGESAFVNQPVMISAELHEIVEARLAAIRPNPPAVINIGSMIGED